MRCRGRLAVQVATWGGYPTYTGRDVNAVVKVAFAASGHAVGRNKRSALRRSNLGSVTRLSHRDGAMRYAYCALLGGYAATARGRMGAVAS